MIYAPARKPHFRDIWVPVRFPPFLFFFIRPIVLNQLAKAQSSVALLQEGQRSLGEDFQKNLNELKEWIQRATKAETLLQQHPSASKR